MFFNWKCFNKYDTGVVLWITNAHYTKEAVAFHLPFSLQAMDYFGISICVDDCLGRNELSCSGKHLLDFSPWNPMSGFTESYKMKRQKQLLLKQSVNSLFINYLRHIFVHWEAPPPFNDPFAMTSVSVIFFKKNLSNPFSTSGFDSLTQRVSLIHWAWTVSNGFIFWLELKVSVTGCWKAWVGFWSCF